MARPQGYKASRTGRATGKGKIGTTIAKGFKPWSRSIENRGSEQLALPVKLQQQKVVADRSRIGRSTIRQLYQFVVLGWEKVLTSSATLCQSEWV